MVNIKHILKKLRYDSPMDKRARQLDKADKEKDKEIKELKDKLKDKST